MKCSDLVAAQSAEKHREEHIEQMSGFCFEKVLSAEWNIKLVDKAENLDG